jgi:hypothetical protein
LVDKHLKDLTTRLNAVSGSNENNEMTMYDDYYLDIGEQPPRFIYYRKVRWEKFSDWEKLTCYDPDETITQDELDFSLKLQLRVTPEERYQKEKRNYYWHEL